MISLATRLRRAWAAWQAIRDHKRLMALAGSTPFDLVDLLAADARLRSLPDRRPWWRDRTLLQYDGFRWGVSLEWKLADLWIGAFFKNREQPGYVWAAIYYDGRSVVTGDKIRITDLWICILPCLPIHVRYSRL